MKNVILNAPVLGLNGETLVAQTGRTVAGQNGQLQAEQAPIVFGKLALDSIIRSRTQTDEQNEILFNLAEKLNNIVKVTTPQTLELSDEEFEAVKAAIDREAVIVKARFLQMVEELNPAV